MPCCKKLLSDVDATDASVSQLRAAPRVVRILPTWKLPARPLHVVCVRDRQATPKLRCFIDFIVERFKPNRQAN